MSATITNTGSVAGDEVAQLYLSLGDGEPPKVLRGFERLTIAPGASATFTADLTRRDVSVWDTTVQNWVEVSNPTVFVGASSRNLPLSGTLSSGGSSGGAPPSSPPAQHSSDAGGYPHLSASASGPPPVVSQSPDGQPIYPTGAPVSQLSDGQPQWHTAQPQSTSTWA